MSHRGPPSSPAVISPRPATIETTATATPPPSATMNPTPVAAPSAATSPISASTPLAASFAGSLRTCSLSER